MALPNSAQIRAARALLGWSQPKVSAMAGVAVNTLSRFESGRRPLTDRTLRDIERVFEENGISFARNGRTVVVSLLQAEEE
ncbi:MAG: helix-turn-helix transcriptional regulator [Candidatus Devosia phytovorans]|uniref:Helix-turn-helix transcriptional regulator n=1 Tax=Candidatus Devosia phytovorans TaxID=3121372 RepID=A0AAJ5VUZ8_9HYPH|nr:helix-turn-helix transcriptional regulator [Devosia sp.]WEK03874.1 MAG: helix-turn-helix transcriptional regulator [Devosia sp.]